MLSQGESQKRLLAFLAALGSSASRVSLREHFVRTPLSLLIEMVVRSKLCLFDYPDHLVIVISDGKQRQVLQADGLEFLKQERAEELDERHPEFAAVEHEGDGFELAGLHEG